MQISSAHASERMSSHRLFYWVGLVGVVSIVQLFGAKTETRNEGILDKRCSLTPRFLWAKQILSLSAANAFFERSKVNTAVYRLPVQSVAYAPPRHASSSLSTASQQNYRRFHPQRPPAGRERTKRRRKARKQWVGGGAGVDWNSCSRECCLFSSSSSCSYLGD